MAGVAALFLLFLRHADPEPEEKKAYGGSVRLMLAGSSADASAFWNSAKMPEISLKGLVY